jgi:uncharacterized protein (DUF1330 family)
MAADFRRELASEILTRDTRLVHDALSPPTDPPIQRSHAMPAYLIADTYIKDAATYDEYKKQVAPIIARYGGRFLVRGGKLEVLEGTWRPERLVVIEFPSMEALKSWYASPEYAPVLAMRQPAADDHLVAVEGY